LYSAPYIPNQLVLGATNQVTDIGRELATVEDVRSLLSMAQRELNYLLSSAQILSINTGYRPVSTDGIPLIGKVPMQNIFLCTGTRRDGWHLSPFLSQEISKIMIEDLPAAELSVYSPTRKPYRLISRERSIELAARHYTSAMYQHGLVMPYGNYRNHLVRNYEAFFTDLHDYAGFDDFGIPIDLIAYASQKMNAGEEIQI
jgi:glycine/D-amino acid oxidase-like deaminating enzyme